MTSRERFSLAITAAAVFVGSCFLATGLPAQAIAPDSACLALGRAARDSLGKRHLASTTYTRYQDRASATLEALLVLKCTRAGSAGDTVFPVPLPTPNQPPIPDFTFGCVDRSPQDWRCTFNGSTSRDPDGAVAAWAWSTPTQPNRTGQSIIFGLTAGQSYDITLTVTDDSGATATITRAVAIGPSTPPPPPPDTTQPPPSPVDTTPPPPPAAGIAPHSIAPGLATLAELPRAQPPPWNPDGQCTVTVGAGELQSAVNAAIGGDHLCVPPGVIAFKGTTLTLPKRFTGGRVVIRTAPSAGWVPPGTRITRTAPLGIIEGTGAGAQSTIKTAPGASGWAFVHLEIRVDSAKGELAAPTAIVELTSTADSSGHARDILFDRVIVRAAPHQRVLRCIDASGIAVSIVNSIIDECHSKGAEAQAILLWGGPGPYLIANNYLAGAGENFMSGGLRPLVRGVIPSDIWIHSNHFNTPIAWKGVWLKKNVIETKNVRRILIERNVIEGSWSDGQTGTCVQFKPANNAVAGYTWAALVDLTFRDNYVKHCSGAVDLDGTTYTPYDSIGRRVTFYNNVYDSLAHGPYAVGVSRCYWIGNSIEDLTIDGDVCVNGGSLQRGVVGGQKRPGAVRLTMRNVSMPNVVYPWFTCTGTPPPGVAGCYGALEFVGNVFRGPQKPGFPSGFTFDPSASIAAQLARIRQLTAGVVQP